MTTKNPTSAVGDVAKGAKAIALVRWGDEKLARLVYRDQSLPVFLDESGRLCAFKSALKAHADAHEAQLDALRVRMTEEAAKAGSLVRHRNRRPAIAPPRRARRDRKTDARAERTTA
jgi:hypothetical protein